MAILYTNGATVSLSLAELGLSTQILYSAAEPKRLTTIQLTTEVGSFNFAPYFIGHPAKVILAGGTNTVTFGEVLGRSGNDVISGNGGADTLWGGGGERPALRRVGQRSADPGHRAGAGIGRRGQRRDPRGLGRGVGGGGADRRRGANVIRLFSASGTAPIRLAAAGMIPSISGAPILRWIGSWPSRPRAAVRTRS